MKGTLYNINNKWVVKYYISDVTGGTSSTAIGILPLHPDDIQDEYHYGDHFRHVNIVGRLEIEFEIIDDFEQTAKLIEHEIESWKNIRDQILKEVEYNSQVFLEIEYLFNRLENQYNQPSQKSTL